MTEQLTSPPAAPPAPSTRREPTLVWAIAGALTVVVLVVTRLHGLTRSLWWDEAFTAQRYVRGGAEVILDPDRYVANNHVLYSLLSSWTADVLGLGDAIVRLWVVVPALVAAGLVLWWAWRRLSPALAVTATALLALSPFAVRLQTEARGYGLVLLAASVLLVVTSRGAELPARWRDDLVVAGAGVVGMLTFPPVVALYLAHTGVWFLRRREQRWRLLVLTAAAGALTFLVLRPLLAIMLAGADRVGSRAAEPITWWSPVVGPLQVLGGVSFNPVLPGGSALAGTVTAVVGVVGIAALVAGRATGTRHLDVALQLVAALGVSIALLGTLGFALLDRYVAFTLPSVTLAVGAGLLALARLATRARPVATAAVVLTVLTVAVVVGLPTTWAETALPRQNFADAVDEVREVAPATIVVRRLHVGYAWYLDRLDLDTVRTDDGDEATAAFCEGERPAVYLPDPDMEPGDGPACLDEAERRSVPQRVGTEEMVWYELR